MGDHLLSGPYRTECRQYSSDSDDHCAERLSTTKSPSKTSGSPSPSNSLRGHREMESVERQRHVTLRG